MGGVPPLAYDVCDRRLVVNRAEAATVKHIHERYLALGSVRLLRNDLERRGIVSKIRVSKKGMRSGGRQFSRGALYQMLSNPIYLGEIPHKKERHPGQHEPIVGRDLWEKVQRRLRDQATTHRERPTKTLPSPLAGRLFDENGEPLYVQGGGKGARHYRYYVSRGLVRGSVQDEQRGWRVAAPELERAVRAATRQILGDRERRSLERSSRSSTSMRTDCLRYSRSPKPGFKACGPKRKPHQSYRDLSGSQPASVPDGRRSTSQPAGKMQQRGEHGSLAESWSLSRWSQIQGEPVDQFGICIALAGRPWGRF